MLRRREACLPRHSFAHLARRRQAGQHLGEYAFVLGVVALAAIAVQFIARRAIQRGVQSASDVVMGRHVRPGGVCPNGNGCLDTNGDGACDCDDANRDCICDASTSDLTATSTETGLGGGRRQTVVVESVAGQGENVHVSDRPLGLDNTAIPRPPPGTAIPRPPGGIGRRPNDN